MPVCTFKNDFMCADVFAIILLFWDVTTLASYPLAFQGVDHFLAKNFLFKGLPLISLHYCLSLTYTDMSPKTWNN